jgi:hypothetical protein
MPIYEYEGQQYDIDTEDRVEAKNKILAYLSKQTPAAPEGPIRAAEDAPDFTRGVGNIVPQLQNVASGAKALTGVVAKKMGFNETGDSLIASGLQGMKKSEAEMVIKDSDEFTEAWEKGIGTVITDWLPYQAGAGVGSLLETLGFMAIGATAGAVGGAGVGALPGAVGGAISKTLIKQGVKEAAEKIVKEQGKEAAEKFVINEAKKAAVKMGATAGMVGQAGMHGIGEVGGRAIEEAQERGLTPEDINLYKALPAAGVHAVADFVANKIMLGALSPTGKSGKSLALEIAKRITTTGAKELVPEEIQTIAERFGAELSLTDAEAIKEYVNTAAASFGMSVVPGTIGGVRNRFSSKLREDANAAKEESEKKTSAGTLDKAATEVNGTQDPEILAKLQPTVDADGNPLAAPSQTTVAATQEMNEVAAQNNQIKQDEGGANVPVTNADNTAGGASAAISGQPAGEGAATTAGGTPATVAQGLGGTDTTAAIPPAGTPAQQAALTPQATSQVAAPPVATPSFTPAPVQQVQVAPTNKPPTLDFNTWLDSKGISLTDIQSDAEFAELQNQYQAEVGGAAPASVAAPVIEQAPTDVFNTVKNVLSKPEKISELDKKAKAPGLPGTVIKEAKVAKPIKAAGPVTEAPSAQNYLNKNSYYASDAPVVLAAQEIKLAEDAKKAKKKEITPRTAEQIAVDEAGFDQAFDDFDSVDYENGVLPVIKARVDELNAKQEAKRKEIRDRMTAEGKNKKAIDAAVSKVKKYSESSPLDFMSLDELVALYQEHAQKADFEGGDARRQAAADRQEFLKGLDPSQSTKVNMVYERVFAQEVQSDAVGRTTTDADLRKRRDKKYKQKLINQVRDQVKQAKRTEAESDVVMEKRAERVAKYKEEKATEEGAKEAAKITKVAGKSKLDATIEEAVATGDAEQVLAAVADRKLNDRMTGVMAQTFQKLLKTLVVDTQVVFGEVEQSADGKFDPATNTITLKGTPEQGYTGKRNLAEVVMHEISHSVLDHVFDNPKAFINSLPADKKASVQAALNRLSNHHKVLVKAFGKRYDIATMKEFAAEFWSNRAFQMELAMMPSPTPYTAKENFFTTIVKTIASALGISDSKEGATFKEIAEDLAQLISVPSDKIVGKEVSFAEAKKAPEYRETGINEDDTTYDVSDKDQSKNLRKISKLFFTAPGWREIATKFQNSRYHIKYWQDKLDLAGLIQDEGRDKINNIYTQITLAASSAKNYYNQYVKDTDEQLQKAVAEFSKASGLDVNKGLNKLFRILEALHEGERRHEKYLMLVPLSNNKVLNGGQLSPADRRAQIYGILDTNVKLSESQKQQLKTELEAIVKKYADPLGVSPRSNIKKDGTVTPLPVDEQNEMYNVTGLSPAARDLRIQQFNALPAGQKKLADEVIKRLGELHAATTELNMIGNYWSQPVSNRVGFYNFNHYIPLKGITESNEDQALDFDSERMGRELQDIEHSFDGRTTVSNNPILQSRADATRAAMRAGRKDLTQSIKNAITKNADGKQLLAGYIKKTLSFAERRDSKELADLKGENSIFHYNEDGSVDVLVVQNKEQREAIRRTYKDTKPFVDYANRATSFLGALHTRYNYNFAPMNFVRDALTNAFTMSAEMGPGEAARYIKAIAGRSIQGGMSKAIDISVAYEKGDTAALARMKKTDPIAADMIEFIERGGMVSYLQGLSIKSNFESLQKELGRSRIARGKEQVDKVIDIWTDMFELSSRSAAYAITKRHEMSKGKSEEAATIRAVAYAKNLANFEQVGDFGKTMGAFYMFYRPAATGAVRAIESVIPAFRTLEGAVQGLPSAIKEDPKALKTYKENYAERQKYARITLASSMAGGMLVYAMAQMLADDDELGRNKVEADNMQQWTRFARFHLPKSLTGENDYIIQIPWGFGLGAFAAAGAQLAGAAAGKGSFGDALWNTATQISLDSFIPIPVSRMDASVDPLPFFLDSVMPSTLRPILEFVINKNGLGQDIYSDRNRRMGDAYTGSDRIPEIYRDLARNLANITGGYIDWSPNTVYFLANSYLDGIAKVGEISYGTLDVMQGNKSFDPKKDLPLFGSFVGSKSNFDSREFTKVENQIKEMERLLNMFKEDPVQYAKFTSKNPFAEVLVEQYNQNINGSLKDLRADLNTYRKMKLPQKERKAIIDALTLQSNIIKRGMIEEFKAYGIKP